jgi:SAM-dependent methyltransferase
MGHPWVVDNLEERFYFACPVCESALTHLDKDVFVCIPETIEYKKVDGIWRFLPSERVNHYENFIRDYQTIRNLEGRGDRNPEFYRALPFIDLTGKWRGDWRIRSKSFTTFVNRVLIPIERQLNRSLKIIDMGAGNGWLSNHLAGRGHSVIALDLLINPEDGLGAWTNYKNRFLPVQAEFDFLPFLPCQFDLIVFNASFHYSIEYTITIKEVLEKLVPGGHIIILDTPFYKNAESGEKMVKEREENFAAKFGLPSNTLPVRNYLTREDINRISKTCNITWNFIKPNHGLEWFLRQWRVRLKARREPATFYILIAQKSPRSE